MKSLVAWCRKPRSSEGAAQGAMALLMASTIACLPLGVGCGKGSKKQETEAQMRERIRKEERIRMEERERLARERMTREGMAREGAGRAAAGDPGAITTNPLADEDGVREGNSPSATEKRALEAARKKKMEAIKREQERQRALLEAKIQATRKRQETLRRQLESARTGAEKEALRKKIEAARARGGGQRRRYSGMRHPRRSMGTALEGLFN